MKKLLFIASASVIFAISVSATVLAHHSFAAEYDASKPVTVKGTIVKMLWVNPHGWLIVEVKEPDGSVATWSLEFGSPNSLLKRGWRKEDLPVGVEVTATGYLSKKNPKAMNTSTVTLANGKQLFAGSQGSGSPEQ